MAKDVENELKKDTNKRDSKNKNQSFWLAFWERNRDKILVGIILATIGLVLASLWSIILPPPVDSFTPDVELEFDEHVNFFGSDRNESSYQTSLKMVYSVVASTTTEITFKTQEFSIDNSSMQFLNSDKQNGNYSVSLIEKSVFSGVVQEPTEIILEASLDNFWVNPDYISNYTEIQIGVLSFEVLVTDKKTNESYSENHLIDVGWVTEREYYALDYSFKDITSNEYTCNVTLRFTITAKDEISKVLISYNTSKKIDVVDFNNYEFDGKPDDILKDKMKIYPEIDVMVPATIPKDDKWVRLTFHFVNRYEKGVFKESEKVFLDSMVLDTSYAPLILIDSDNDQTFDICYNEKNHLNTVLEEIKVLELYLIDADGDDIYDFSYNETNALETDLAMDYKGNYLIDNDGDGWYDYVYTSETGATGYLVEAEEDYTTLLVLVVLAIIIFVIVVALNIRKK